jgi:hypothetical protein
MPESSLIRESQIGFIGVPVPLLPPVRLAPLLQLASLVRHGEHVLPCDAACGEPGEYFSQCGIGTSSIIHENSPFRVMDRLVRIPALFV